MANGNGSVLTKHPTVSFESEFLRFDRGMPIANEDVDEKRESVAAYADKTMM